MQRTTIMLPEELKRLAQQVAQAQGVSLGVLICNVLARALETTEEVPRATDPLFADDAVFSGEAPADLAACHDTYLYADSAG